MQTTPTELALGYTLSFSANLITPSRPNHFDYGDYATRFTQHVPPRQASSPQVK